MTTLFKAEHFHGLQDGELAIPPGAAWTVSAIHVETDDTPKSVHVWHSDRSFIHMDDGTPFAFDTDAAGWQFINKLLSNPVKKFVKFPSLYLDGFGATLEPRWLADGVLDLPHFMESDAFMVELQEMIDERLTVDTGNCSLLEAWRVVDVLRKDGCDIEEWK